jgi:hypothetical protein
MIAIKVSASALARLANILGSRETIGIAASSLLGSEEVDILKGKVK